MDSVMYHYSPGFDLQKEREGGREREQHKVVNHEREKEDHQREDKKRQRGEAMEMELERERAREEDEKAGKKDWQKLECYCLSIGEQNSDCKKTMWERAKEEEDEKARKKETDDIWEKMMRNIRELNRPVDISVKASDPYKQTGKLEEFWRSTGCYPYLYLVDRSKELELYEEELEINDFPVNVRLQLTRRENWNPICFLTLTDITIRGQYFPPGKIPGPGEQKLCLCIKGYGHKSVKKAIAELKRYTESGGVEETDPLDVYMNSVVYPELDNASFETVFVSPPPAANTDDAVTNFNKKNRKNQGEQHHPKRFSFKSIGIDEDSDSDSDYGDVEDGGAAAMENKDDEEFLYWLEKTFPTKAFPTCFSHLKPVVYWY